MLTGTTACRLLSCLALQNCATTTFLNEGPCDAEDKSQNSIVHQFVLSQVLSVSHKLKGHAGHDLRGSANLCNQVSW